MCTYTNVAVDNLVEGLVSAGLKPLRIGSGERVKSSLDVYTLDHKISIHPLKPQIDNLAIKIKEEEANLIDLVSCISLSTNSRSQQMQ